MANEAGKQTAITSLTPMEPSQTALLRATVAARKLGFGKQSRVDLLALSFIHFARWAIVDRDAFPHLDDEQPEEDLEYDYLLFCSNFNGTWGEYIDAFSSVLPAGMDRIWKWSVNYPGAEPITPFKEYIHANQLDNDHYYSAYPGASTNDVKRALHLQRELDAFEASSSELADEEFAVAWAELLVRVSGDLQTTGVVDRGQ